MDGLIDGKTRFVEREGGRLGVCIKRIWLKIRRLEGESEDSRKCSLLVEIE